MKALDTGAGAGIAIYFLIQHSIVLPTFASAFMVLSWFVAVFLDLHSTMRHPSMMCRETNPLFAFLYRKLSWGAVPVQLAVELGILIGISLLFHDFLQTLGLACAAVCIIHVWCWHKNERFRKTNSCIDTHINV